MESLIPENTLYSTDDSVDDIPFDILHEYNKLDSTVEMYNSIADTIIFDHNLAYDIFEDAIQDYYTEMNFIPIM